MGVIQIRKAEYSDREAILDVTLSSYSQYAAIMPRAHWQFYQANIRSTLADIEQADQFVAELDGKVVGSVLLYRLGKLNTDPQGNQLEMQSPEVRLLAVAPGARGRGVGFALMNACIDQAARAKAQSITLHTNDMMQAAVRLYERMGFQRAPELDFSPVEGVVIKGYRYGLV
jgi:ribosomal protein S18 acetylase RimI-like enzyme